MRLKIGILGCGWIAEHAHIPVLLRIHGVETIALYDQNETRVRSLALKYGITETYSEFEKFLECGVDAVVIATPNYTHAPYSKVLLEHNINVMCEKPIALNEKDIKEVLELASKKKLVFFPAMVNRYRKDIQCINKFLKEEKIGNVKEIEAGWIRNNGIPRPGTWFTNKDLSGGGVLIDLGSHILDICFMFLGDKQLMKYESELSMCDDINTVEEASAEWFHKERETQYKIDVEDNAKAKILFMDNTKMNIDLSWRSYVKADYTYFFIEGEEGRIDLKTLFGFSTSRLWEKDTLVLEKNGKKEQIYLGGYNTTRDAFEVMHRDFINKIMSKRCDNMDTYSAFNVVSIIEKLYGGSYVVDRNLLETKRMMEI